MSSLYKLSICGVRSFSPKDHETIQFGTPLTLICGQNGCGKTTIIECLKYATTGDLPPNSKGGAFVNDPAIADRLMVNAEIKLGFISVDSKLMTVTRNMQLTRKRARGTATTNTFKTLEGQLAVISKGHKTAISTKNAELDARVPQYLGASRAVLEYVIFCHQDDSLWPLSEAGILKKRFDEIFEALKFTKVLDNLKGIRKDMASDIRLIEQSVQHAKVDKVRAQKIRERLAESTALAENYTLEIADLTMRIEQLEREAEMLFNSNQSFQRTLSEHSRLSLVFENVKTNYLRLAKSIVIMDLLDADLGLALANSAADHEAKTVAFLELEKLLAKSHLRLLELRSGFNELTRQEGLLCYKRDEYILKKNQLELLAFEISQKHYQTDTMAFPELTKELEKTLNLQQKQLEVKLSGSSELLESATSRLSSCQNDISKEELSKSHYTRELQTTEASTRDLKAKVALIASKEDQLEEEKEELENLKTRRQKHSHQNRVQELQERLSRDKLSLVKLEMDLEQLVSDLAAASSLAELHTKRTLVQSNYTRKKNQLERICADLKLQYEKLVGSPLNAADITPLDEKVSELELERKDIQASVSKLQKEVNMAVATAQSTENSLQTARHKLKQHASAIRAIISEEDIPKYEELVNEIEEDHKTAVFNLNTFEVTRSYKVKAIAIAKANKCCALCNRGFGEGEESRFVKELEESVKVLTTEKLQEDLNSTANDLEEMKSIHVDVIQWRKLIDETLTLKTTVESLNIKSEEAKASLFKEEGSLSGLIDKLSKLLELKSPIAAFSRDSVELNDLNDELNDLNEKLGAVGPDVSIFELQSLQKKKNSEAKTLRQAIADSVEELQSLQNESTRLDGQIKDKQLLISNLEKSFGESIAIKNRITENEAQYKSLQSKITETNNLIITFKGKFEKLTKEVDDLKSSREKDKEIGQSAIDALRKDFDLLQNIHKEINKYEMEDAPVLKDNTLKLETIRESITSTKAEIQDSEEKSKQLQGEITDFRERERQVRDNLEYRQLQKELDEYQQKLNELDVKNAEVEKENYQLSSKRIRDQITELTSSLYGKEGEVKQIKDQIKNFQKELETEFKDIDKQYHKEWVKLQTNLLVSNDLQTYSQALDNAIMKYHSMKMDEINRILRELWNQTYKGTDIDGIEIKCDVSSLGKGRSYNYRVVMYKKSSELDMRGRCSAGQKVLTSILIRLALAECFGTNCGMIALDEPTTNLDVENAESLAIALNNIIDLRKNQKNFQLIVITHDEKFLSHINGDSYTDNFYRIERNENQNSIIKSLPIHLMQDD